MPQRALEHGQREGRFESRGLAGAQGRHALLGHVVIDPIRERRATCSASPRSRATSPSGARRSSSSSEAREALFQSQKMDAIGKLTGGVAHDFNNLLTAVLGSLELVQRRIGDDPRIAPLVANAMQAAQRGAALTQRMLAFARRQDPQARRPSPFPTWSTT